MKQSIQVIKGELGVVTTRLNRLLSSVSKCDSEKCSIEEDDLFKQVKKIKDLVDDLKSSHNTVISILEKRECIHIDNDCYSEYRVSFSEVDEYKRHVKGLIRS